MARTTSSDGLRTSPEDGDSIGETSSFVSSSSGVSMEFSESEQERNIDSDISLDRGDTYCQVGGILGAIRRFFFGAQYFRPPRYALEECMLCPIQQQIMMDPVIDPDGHSYERKAILKWLEKNSISPLTRRPLTARQLKENRGLKAVIHEYLVGGYANRMKRDDEGSSEA